MEPRVAEQRKPSDGGFEVVPQEKDENAEAVKVVKTKKLAKKETAKVVEAVEKQPEPKKDLAPDAEMASDSFIKEEEIVATVTEKPKEKTHRGHRFENGEKPRPVVMPVVHAAAVETKPAEVFSGDKFSDLPINDKLKQAL